MAKYEVEVKAYKAEHPLYAAWLAASTKRASAAAKAKGKAKRGRKASKGTGKIGNASKKKAAGGSSFLEADDSEASAVSRALGLHCRDPYVSQ